MTIQKQRHKLPVKRRLIVSDFPPSAGDNLATKKRYKAIYVLGGLGKANCCAFGIGKGGAEVGGGLPIRTTRRCTGGGLLPNIIPPWSMPNRAAGY